MSKAFIGKFFPKRPRKPKTIPHVIRTTSIILSLLILFIFNQISSTLTGIQLYNRSVNQVQTELKGITASIEQTYATYINQSQFFSNNAFLLQLFQADYADIRSSKNQNLSNIQINFQKLLVSLASQSDCILDYYLINTNGVVYCSTFSKMLGKSLKNEPYFSQIDEQQKTVISDLFYFEQRQSNAFLISVPIVFQNNIIGSAITILNSATFDSLIEKLNVLCVQYYITDTKGNIIYANNSSEVGTLFSAKELKAKAMPFINDKTNTKRLEQNNTTYFAKEAHLKESGWIVRNMTSTSSIGKIALGQYKILFIFILLSCILVTITTSLLFKPFTKTMQTILDTLNSISNGDLSCRVPEKTYCIEFSNLCKHINLMIDKLSEMFQTTSDTILHTETSSNNLYTVTQEVETSAFEINQKVNFIAQKATEQNELSHDSASEVMKLGTQIELLYDKNKEMLQYGDTMRHELDQNNTMITILTKKIQKVTDSSNAVSQQVSLLAAHFLKVSEIIQIIENISIQTNLLSLNASIEAARAGNAGRGFSVVANEIRVLSEEVQNAVNNISEIISQAKNITESTKSATEQSNQIISEQMITYKEMQEKFTSMVQAILNMKGISDDINNYVIALTTKKELVLQQMKNMENEALEIQNITKEASESVEEQTQIFRKVNKSAETLAAQAQVAQNMISMYKLEKSSQDPSCKEINRE